MKTKINKLLGIALTLMLLGSLTVGLGVPTMAADGSWSTLATPQAGALGNYVLSAATGTLAGPGPMEKAIDGTLYAYFDNGEGLVASNVYKSTDDARTWTRCSTATDDLGNVAITAIVCSTQDAKRVYVTDGADVYRSLDAGATFVKLAGIPAGSTTIKSLAVGYNGDHFVYIGVDTAVPGTDDVLVLRDAFGYAWATTYFYTVLPGRTVVAVATSPKFATEALPQVMAVSYDTVTFKAYVSFSYGGAAWAAPTPLTDDIELDADLATVGVQSFAAPITAADIAFPADYDSSRTARDFFVGVSTSGTEGGVYRIISSTPLRVLGTPAGAINITSVAVAGNSGSCKLLAAGTTSRDVWHSEDNAVSWIASIKDVVQTSGVTAKYIIMDKSYNSNGKAFIAVSTGALLDNSSVAQTEDFGVSWNDLSLINTNIKQIFNMDVSSKYASDSTVFMVTGATAGLDSVWKWDGTYWTRTATMPLGRAATAIIQCSPDYFIDKAVFLADTVSLQIYRSTDYGMWFKAQTSLVPTVFDGGMLAMSSTSILVGSGTTVLITKNNGTSWDPIALPASATAPIFSFAKSPAYSTDSTLLCGDSGGQVFISKNGGLNWTQVPVSATTGGSGGANVAFDSAYATNNYIYVATSTDDRVRRINAATGTAWSTIDSPDRSGAINANVLVPGIQMSANGTMYVQSQTASSTTSGSAADAFRIINSATAADGGFIAVTAGSVIVSGSSLTTTPSSAAPVTVNAGGTTAWAVGAFAGDYITVTANAANTTGAWTQTLITTAAGVVSDVDGDVVLMPNFLPTGGNFSMPDTSATAGAGTTQVVLRSLSGTRTYSERQSSGFTGTAANLRGVWYDDAATNTPQIWTLESNSTTAANNRIWTYTDRLTGAPTLSQPADKTNTGRVTTASLSWNAMSTASFYEVRINLGSTSGPAVAGTPAFVLGTSFAAAGLDDGQTYAWRVRSATVADGGKASSPWSATWTFTTGLSAAEWTPFDNAENVAPVPGAENVGLRPTFQWNPADWATGYEFVLSAAADLSSPIYSFKGTTALKTTVFAADKDLSYSTTYYWSVTAVTATTRSVTAYGVFSTMAAPVAPTPPVTVASPTPAPVTVNLPPAEQIAPVWIWAIIAIGGVLVIAVIVLIVTTRRTP